MKNEPWKVLIVEDNALFRRILSESLCALPGVRVIEAEDIAEGGAQASKHKPDMAFLDIMLPDGNGLDLLDTIKKEAPRCVVGMCSSHDGKEYREIAANRGAAFFFWKHYLDWNEVVQRVEEARKAATCTDRAGPGAPRAAPAS